jgi:histone H2A
MSGKGAKGLSGKGAKGTMAKGDKKKPVSRSLKAGLQFPVGRIHRFLKVRTSQAEGHEAGGPPAKRGGLPARD